MIQLSEHVKLAELIHNRGKFNNASALGRSLYWCQALHIMNKDRYQSTSARQALALLNSPLVIIKSYGQHTYLQEAMKSSQPEFYANASLSSQVFCPKHYISMYLCEYPVKL